MAEVQGPAAELLPGEGSGDLQSPDGSRQAPAAWAASPVSAWSSA